MTEHKVAELSGALLDAAVAKAEGIAVVLRPARFSAESDIIQQPSTEYEFDPEGPANEFSVKEWKMWRHYRPSADWSIAGPIIAREFISLRTAKGKWYGEATRSRTPATGWGYFPLVAAMRAYVASKFGEAVELP